MAYEWSTHDQQAKIVVFQFFFCNFNDFISRFDFQNVHVNVRPRLPNFKFLDSKNENANKNFRKNLLHAKIINAKIFCDTPLLKLKLLENCERPGYSKYPSPSRVFEKNRYQKMVVLIKYLEVISPNYFSFKLNYLIS